MARKTRSEHLNFKSQLIDKLANLVFIIFFILVSKDVLVDVLRIIPTRSLLNRLISYFLIFPLTIFGIGAIIYIGFLSFGLRVRQKSLPNWRHVLLIAPFIFYFLFFFIKDFVLNLSA